jgi:hypothetical protein
MSYTITITRRTIPANDREAWIYLDKLHEQEPGTQAEDFLQLLDVFKQQFPCICDLPEKHSDKGVWGDGPLSDNAGENLTTLGIVYTAVDHVLPIITQIAMEYGFAVFDPQTGEIFALDPDMPLPANPSIPNVQPIKPLVKKSLWTRLLGS